MAAVIRNTEAKSSSFKPCPCKVMEHILYISRIFGIVPLTWRHMHDNCTFKLSYLWLMYSICLLIAVATQLAVFTKVSKFTNIKFITVLLNNIVDVMYLVLIIVLIICNILRSKNFVKYFNQVSKVIKEVNMCRSVGNLTIFVGWSTVGSCIGWIVLQTAVLCYLHFSDSYTTTENIISFFLSKFVQSYTAIYAIFIACIMNTIIGTLACFEKLIRSCLKYTPVHPLKTIVETNNIRDFLGVIKYELCKENHPIPIKMSKFSAAELVEYLRRLHEDICLVVYEYNNCLNPQLLCGIVTALIVLIVQLYSVIVHLGFEIATQETSMVFILNCMSVFIHSIGLFIIFKNIQQYKNMVSFRLHCLILYIIITIILYSISDSWTY